MTGAPPAADHGGVTAALDYDSDYRPQPVLRRGRHRNRALASYRRSRAVEMAAGGCTYQQIADELGYANRGTVHRLVREAREAQQVDSVDLLRTLEVQRLDALQASLWPAALAGDVEAAHVCLRIIIARSKVLGLARLARASGAAVSSRRQSSCAKTTVATAGVPTTRRTGRARVLVLALKIGRVARSVLVPAPYYSLGPPSVVSVLSRT